MRDFICFDQLLSLDFFRNHEEENRR